MYVESSAVTMNNSVIQAGAEYRKLYLKNSNSTINASTVSGAALNAESVGIYIDGGSPTISNSTISNNSIGIFVNSLSNNPTIQNNTFTGNTYAVKLDSVAAVLSGNAATNNTYNGIFVEGATQANTTWQKDSIPYTVNKFIVSAGTTLTIQAGVVVKFINTPYTDSGITVQGTLITQGTALNPVAFTGINDATTWKWIYLAPGSKGSQLTHTTLTYGGNTYYTAALYVKQSSVQVSNLTISNSAQSAIYSSLGTISGSGVTLVNNAYGFHIELGDCPALTNVNVTANVGPTIHPSSFPSPPCSF
jgi:parallel beta-helix repeat protein